MKAEAALNTRGRARRPLSVTMLALGVLTFSAINALRVHETLINWELLAGLLPISPLYLLLSGLVWFFIGIPLTWMFWQGHPKARLVFWIAALGYTLHYWFDRLSFSDGKPMTNWLFCMSANLGILGIVLWIFSNRNVKVYFGAMNAQKSKNSEVA